MKVKILKFRKRREKKSLLAERFKSVCFILKFIKTLNSLRHNSHQMDDTLPHTLINSSSFLSASSVITVEQVEVMSCKSSENQR